MTNPINGVTPGKVLESGHLYLGNPIRRHRKLSAQEIEMLEYLSAQYIKSKNEY